MKARQLIRPDDQLDLTEAELAEEIPKSLGTENTNVVKNLVIYSFQEGEYIHVSSAFLLSHKSRNCAFMSKEITLILVASTT